MDFGCMLVPFGVNCASCFFFSASFVCRLHRVVLFWNKCVMICWIQQKMFFGNPILQKTHHTILQGLWWRNALAWRIWRLWTFDVLNHWTCEKRNIENTKCWIILCITPCIIQIHHVVYQASLKYNMYYTIYYTMYYTKYYSKIQSIILCNLEL